MSSSNSISVKQIPTAQVNCVLSRKKDGSTNYHTWREATTERLKVFYPDIYSEFLNKPVEESSAQFSARMVMEHPMAVLRNDRSTVLEEQRYQQIIGTLSGGRTRASSSSADQFQNDSGEITPAIKRAMDLALEEQNMAARHANLETRISSRRPRLMK